MLIMAITATKIKRIKNWVNVYEQLFQNSYSKDKFIVEEIVVVVCVCIRVCMETFTNINRDQKG